ncbi:unnamed protein product [Rotaria sp. Silwood2]|nr:unnamed protein product [Rotaria sp. Silwood2]
MESTTTQSQNGNSDWHSQQKRETNIFLAERQLTTEIPYNFVLGSRLSAAQPNNQQDLLKHLSCDFAHLLNRMDLSDCLLNVKGTYMAVHRCVLAARSNTFSAIMSGNNSRLDPDIKKGLETSVRNNKLEISIDKTLPEIMKQVIIFMYTAKCELNERNGTFSIILFCHQSYGLLDAAGRYDIKSLKEYTSQLLVNHININNVLKLIESAYVYNNLLLKHKCIDYFIDNGKEVMDTNESWGRFANNYKGIVADLLYWTVHKDEYRQEIAQPQLHSQW